MSATDLQDYVGAAEANDYVQACWDEASDLVGVYVGDVEVPAPVLHRAILEVGSELYHRKNSPQGVAQFAALDGAPVRVARDPMVGAYPILSRFVGGGFA